MSNLTRVCTRCKQIKALDDFGVCKNAKNGHASYCKVCSAKAKRDYYATMPPGYQLEVARKSFLKRKYGMTLESYQALWDAQKGLCAVCGKPETVSKFDNGTIDSLSVDHDHVTGKVRGLLCGRCNTSLGLLYENEIIIQSLLDYIRTHAS